MSSILICIQARMSSARLPGKSLAMLSGKPSLQHAIESLVQGYARSAICVATSTRSDDDPIVTLAQEQRVGCFRGDLENVASRFYEIGKSLRPQAMVRVSGDSPLIDFRVVQAAERLFWERQAEIVSTSVDSSFPSGMNVEVFRTELFLREYPHFHQKLHFEHVTPYFYEHRDRFHLVPLTNAIPETKQMKFSLDTLEDLHRLEKFFANLTTPHFALDLAEKCSLYRTLFVDSP